MCLHCFVLNILFYSCVHNVVNILFYCNRYIILLCYLYYFIMLQVKIKLHWKLFYKIYFVKSENKIDKITFEAKFMTHHVLKWF